MSVLIDTPAASVYEAFCLTCERQPDHEFLSIPKSACRNYSEAALSYSYGAARLEVEALREAYRLAGLSPGMRVATLLENRPAAFFHWFALNGLGVSVVPINPDYRASELSFLLEHSDACLIIAVPGYLPLLREVARLLPHQPPVVADLAVIDGLAPLANHTKHATPHLPLRSDECAVLYTSGTTGRPKGCLLSNDYFIRLGLRYLNRRGYISLRMGSERVLTPLPMFHMNAMASTTLAMVISGGCIIQLDRFHPGTWWSDVVSTRATGIHYLGVMPAILLSLPTSPLDKAHQVRYGTGANVEPKHHAAFEQRFGFPLIEAWAMTETGSGAGMGADEEPRHVGSRCFGRVPPTVEVRLVDEAGHDVTPGTAGEMWVRRAGSDPRLGFFSGYLKDPVATEQAWAGGWWHTGDMARLGADGCMFFVDRKKNVIRRSGENISALEVETLLRACPLIADVAVTAVPDEIRGDEVMACIVLAPDQPAKADAKTAASIVRWALAEAAYHKAPGWVAFVNVLPTTATQKLDRANLRILATRLLEPGREPDAAHGVDGLDGVDGVDGVDGMDSVDRVDRVEDTKGAAEGTARPACFDTRPLKRRSEPIG
jgi:acyl-CoA synthetase (AMP-forming)/AMP-acid ligase II